MLTLSRLRQLGNQLKQVCLLNLMPVLQKTVIRLLITFIQAGSCKLLQTSHQQLPEFCCLLVHASTCHSPHRSSQRNLSRRPRHNILLEALLYKALCTRWQAHIFLQHSNPSARQQLSILIIIRSYYL